jgi:hypothetical protein
MDEINKNVNNPTDMTSEYIITDVMTSTAFNVVGSDLAFYASIYMEYNVGVYEQMYNAEVRVSEPISSSTYNNPWTSMYNNLYNLKVIIEKCSEGGAEEGNYYTLGIAQVLTAYNLAVLTDLMGNVPWSEALQPGVIYTPSLDTQEDIYLNVFKYLDDAIGNLEKSSQYAFLGEQDLLYDGTAESIENWKKFAYGLKARYTMRLCYRSADYNSVIEYADHSFESNSEECKFEYNGATSSSPFYQFYKDRNDFGCSESLHNKLEDRNDPRDDVFFIGADGKSDAVFAPNGTPTQQQDYYGISAISTITAPTYLLSYHEILFLKAEAYARLNDLTNATKFLKEAIVAACGKSNINVTQANAEEYYDSQIASRVTTIDKALSEIMVQKYLAFYEEEAIEAYNDYRRLKAMGKGNMVSLANPLNSSKFPLRYTYGSSDVTTNVNVRNAQGDGSFVYSENVWWAGGNR